LKKYIDDILLGAGLALISLGVFLIYIPAGFMVSGFSLIILAYIVAKSGG